MIIFYRGWNRKKSTLISALLILTLLVLVFPSIKSLIGLSVLKITGRAPHCPWTAILVMPQNQRKYDFGVADWLRKLSIAETDQHWHIQKIVGAHRPYWMEIPDKEENKTLLAHLLSEHKMNEFADAENLVKTGDFVLDCGAHVGVFVDQALRRGARLVVAIEPEPTNIECLRRNFADEIRKGSVIIAPAGVWNCQTTMMLNVSQHNSAQGSLLGDDTAKKIPVQLTSIDQLVSDLKLPRVDYIKMDIEGAEREALTGATNTLKKWSPRLMVALYHLPDDRDYLPSLIRKITPSHQMTPWFPIISTIPQQGFFREKS
jgi:FkbM family methyltransferase